MAETAILLEKLLIRDSKASLTISGIAEPISVPIALVDRHRLKAGIVLTEAQVKQLVSEADYFKARSTALLLLAMRAHSVGELREKLRRKQFFESSYTQVIRELKADRLLDDSAYAAALIRQTIERKPAGRSYLVALLRRKKLDRELAENTVDAALAQLDESDLAVALLEKRWSALSQFDLEKARHKAYTLLARRGISYQAAKAAVELMVKKDGLRS